MSELAGDQPVHKAPPLPSSRPQEVQPFQKLTPGVNSGWITDFRPVPLPVEAEGDLVTGPKAKDWSVRDSAPSEVSSTDQAPVESASAAKVAQKPPAAPPKPTS